MYVTEEIKKGMVKKPKEIQKHKTKQNKTRTDETKHYVKIFHSFSVKCRGVIRSEQ